MRDEGDGDCTAQETVGEVLCGFVLCCVLRTVKSPFEQINFQVPVRLEILLKTHHCHLVEVRQRTELCLKSVFNAGQLAEGFPAFLPPKGFITYPPPKLNL